MTSVPRFHAVSLTRRSFFVVVAALAACIGIFSGPSIAQGDRTYRIVGVASNDVLNIRSGGSMAYPIVGIIPPDGRGITIVGPCAGRWCVIDYQSTRGWVNTKHLAAEFAQGPAPTRGCRVVGVAYNDVLNMRDGPSIAHAIVGIIPPNGRGVVPVSRPGTWWRVDYEGTIGWVNSNYLAC